MGIVLLQNENISKMKRRKLFIYTLLVIAAFAASLVIIERNRERRLKTEGLEAKLDSYTEIIKNYIGIDPAAANMDYMMALLPENIRITIIMTDGTVVFDNEFEDAQHLENRRDRPEIKTALAQNVGSNIRKSESTGNMYLYYAKHFNTYFVRVALPYDIGLQTYLHSDNIFLYIVVALFIIIIIALRNILYNFGKSISRLKDFAVSVQRQSPDVKEMTFPDDELGQIAQSVVSAYRQLEQSRKTIDLEREKLQQHFHYSRVGLCFFTADRKKVYANTHFIQLMNVVIDQPTFSPEKIFEEPAFAEIGEYLDKTERQQPLFTKNISQNGKILNVRVFIFEDRSFEITLNDVTKSEKNRLIKYELTNSIAHELRTPVTSIRGFLETIIDNNLDEETRKSFIKRAYAQIVRLSELIRDIGFITKIEETGDRFPVEKIQIKKLLDELVSETNHILSQHNITIDIDVADSAEIQGNRSLMYAIFSNLIENSLRHGGNGIRIRISAYTEDANYYYFSFSDTGKGVGEKHLNRIFERFYCANEGRSRDTGGSGLGLSIVKNAVLFHKGEIIAKNSTDGGLEFLFTLGKGARAPN